MTSQSDCYTNLKDMWFDGSKKRWQLIQAGEHEEVPRRSHSLNVQENLLRAFHVPGTVFVDEDKTVNQNEYDFCALW